MVLERTLAPTVSDSDIMVFVVERGLLWYLKQSHRQRVISSDDVGRWLRRAVLSVKSIDFRDLFDGLSHTRKPLMNWPHTHDTDDFQFHTH